MCIRDSVLAVQRVLPRNIDGIRQLPPCPPERVLRHSIDGVDRLVDGEGDLRQAARW